MLSKVKVLKECKSSDAEFTADKTAQMMTDWANMLDAHQFAEMVSDWLGSSLCGEEDVIFELICAYVRNALQLPEAISKKIWAYCDNLAFAIWKDEFI